MNHGDLLKNIDYPPPTAPTPILLPHSFHLSLVLPNATSPFLQNNGDITD